MNGRWELGGRCRRLDAVCLSDNFDDGPPLSGFLQAELLPASENRF
jgi:hypothetical protein